MSQERQPSRAGAVICVMAALVMVYGISFVPVFAWLNGNDPFGTPTGIWHNGHLWLPRHKQLVRMLYAPCFMLCGASPSVDRWVIDAAMRVREKWPLTSP